MIPLEILSEHYSLSSPGTLGFYKSFEVTEIFAIPRNSKAPFNLYSIIVGSEKKILDKSKIFFLNGKPRKISDEYTLGIARYNVSHPRLRMTLRNYFINKRWLLSGNELKVEDLLFYPKQYIPPNGTYSSDTNFILKNNFYSGSYIIEGINPSKKLVEVFFNNKDYLEILVGFIKNYLPIQMENCLDRLGNIIIQYPIETIRTEIIPKKNDKSVLVNIQQHKKNLLPLKLSAVSITRLRQELDILGFAYRNLQDNTNELITGDTSTINETYIFNENNLVLSSFIGTTIAGISFKSSIGTGQIRIIKTNSPSSINGEDVISTYKSSKSHIGNVNQRFHWHFKAKHENETVKLQKNLSFVQYGKNNNNDSSKAIQDLRLLINKYGEYGIMVWDPYLSYDDIERTLFYCAHQDSKMRAISSYDSGKKKVLKELGQIGDEEDYVDWKSISQKKFQDNKYSNTLNLEFRVQHAIHGWKFHDRFIMFYDQSFQTCRAWSLGTSINSFGKHHHIMLEVKNSWHILNAFNELWEQLNNESCVVWKST